MKRVVIPKQYVPPKNWKKTFNRLTDIFQKELEEAIDVYHCCFALAMHERGYSSERIIDLVQKAHDENKVLDDTNLYIVGKLQQETGIELANRDGKLWNETIYFDDKKMKEKEDAGLSIQEWILLRNEERKWVDVIAVASLFLILWKEECMDGDDIEQMFIRMVEIKCQYYKSIKPFIKYTYDTTGVEFVKVPNGFYLQCELDAMKG